MNQPKRMGAKILVAVAGTSVSLAGMALPAEAHGGNCYHVKQEKESFGANEFRVRAYCSSLQANSKAQGTLIIDGSSDKHTVWFTVLNTYKYSDYTSLYGWEYGGTRVVTENV